MKKKINPRSLRNLRHFKKGHSGNPGGRPKNVISEATRDWLKLIDPRTGKTNAKLIAQALGKKALKGETAAYCALRDTTGGRPAQTQQHEIVSSSPLKVRVEAPDLIAAIRQIYGLRNACGESPQTSEGENRC
jgi:hypothetical protein